MVPNPRPLVGCFRSLAQVARHRMLPCHQYDACLDRAADAGWLNFTCSQCPLFVEGWSASEGDGPAGDLPADGKPDRRITREHREKLRESMRKAREAQRARKESTT